MLIRRSTNAEKLVKIGPLLAEIFSGICRFLPSLPKNTIVTLAISGVTGQILIKCAHDVVTILQLNIVDSELPHSY